MRCDGCGEPTGAATLHDGGPLAQLLDHIPRPERDERTLLGPPAPDDERTLREDLFAFRGGRIAHPARTQALGSVGSTAPDAPATPDALLEATAIQMPGVRPTRGLLEPGDDVESYRVIREVGRGGMGRVYQAEHRITGQRVALKMLLPQLVGDARLKARFVNEAKVLARLEHPNLVQLLGFIDTRDAAFIVMPFVEGLTLDRMLQRQGQLDIDTATDLFTQMCAGLDHMHRHGVMHRDLKPSNVIVQADGRVRITDFGIARAIGSQKLTMDGMVVGTAEYLPPEQASGTDRDNVASDQYALAILLYEMLTGRVPFRHPSAAKVLVKQVSAAPPPPRTIRPEIPVGVEVAILRALQKAPDERFPDMMAFCEAVRAGVGDDAPTEEAPRPAAVASPKRPWAFLAQILLGGIIGAGLAALAWYLMR